VPIGERENLAKTKEREGCEAVARSWKGENLAGYRMSAGNVRLG